MTKVYKHKGFTNRNYECVNVVMQITSGAPRNMDGSEDTAGNWVQVDAQEVTDILELTGMEYPEYCDFEPLGGFADHRFYGYM